MTSYIDKNSNVDARKSVTKRYFSHIRQNNNLPAQNTIDYRENDKL